MRFLVSFASVAIGLGLARALTTAYVPVLLEEIDDNPGLIGAVMLVNAVAGFAVPLGAGWWSDRRGTRAPFVLGGSLLAGGGLAAIALGNASTYLALALAATAVYVGLNAATTAHRALVAERFADAQRPRATSAQEVALLVGALLGTVAGGFLVEAAPALLFAAAAVAVPVLALPTLGLKIVRERSAPVAAPRAEHTFRSDLLRVARTPGAREVLAAQVLWVYAYVALTPFMVLYAEHVLSLGAGAAGLILAGFGVLSGGAMIASGRLAPERLRGALLAGVLALGGGLVLAVPASSIALAAIPFALAAVGAGVVTALGFPYFARFIPEGQEGAYSGAFFSGRALALAAALPSAGGLIALTGSYRALLGMGLAALVAAIPLARAEEVQRAPRRVRLAPLPGWGALGGALRYGAPRLAIGMAGVIAVGAALPQLQGTDERIFREVNGIGQGPDLLYRALDPHSRNYAILILLAVLGAVLLRRGRYIGGAFLAMLLAAFGSDAVLEVFQVLFDRPRPEEALGGAAQLVDGRTWAHLPSFPSGHMMVTAALVVAAAQIVPRLRGPLLLYLGAIAVTRITFGAHFPLDVAVGTAMGWEVGLFSVALVRAAGLLPSEGERVRGWVRLPEAAPQRP
jgi:membrane-associated phospholipid phosphatase/predicted MFS family arabinose efflux permease